MELLKSLLSQAASLIWSTPEFFPLMIILLLFTGFFMTMRTRFIQFRQFIHGWKVILGLYDNPEDPGDISHFQAISAALSATVGIGNIAGVATAIHYGGPGALFWMWVTALLGMSLKYAEAVLAIKFRKIHPDGTVSGGPMYYIEKGLGPNFKWMAVFFAVMLVIASFGIGNTIQAFTVADQMRADLSIPIWITGLLTASIVGLVIIGGIKRIGKVASFLAPGMCAIYILGGLTILAINYQTILPSLGLIFKSAFTPTAGIGGFAGSTFLYMLMWGVKRGLFSNEAGQGSSPIAHAAAKTNEPVREGVVAMLGPFIDTILVCTITGLVIVCTGVWYEKVPETVLFNAQADITVVERGAEIVPDAEIRGAHILGREIICENGIAENADFIRNHSIVEKAVIIVDDIPYSGKLFISEAGIPETDDADSKIELSGLTLQNGSPLTSLAFQRGLSRIGNWGGMIITIGVFLFAISTAISWSYYGDRGAEYLFGGKAVIFYRIIYVVMHFIGAVVSLEVVWSFGDVANGLMAIPNLIALIFLSGIVYKITLEYTSRPQLTYKQIKHRGNN